MKIYIASSWKQEKFLKSFAQELSEAGHNVDLFCDSKNGRFVFSFFDLGDPSQLDQFDINKNPLANRAFKEDFHWIQWSDVVILTLPCGNSAHLEAGYAKGLGKKLFIYGPFQKGQIDVMYQFADGIFRSIGDLLKALK